MDNLTFENKIALLVLAKDKQAKAELISRWSNDPEFHYGFNGSKMPLKQFMEQAKFKQVAEQNKELRKNMTNRGWNKSKSGKHIAEIPADIFFKRPEFSAYLPNKQLKANINKFLKDYPDFRVDK